MRNLSDVLVRLPKPLAGDLPAPAYTGQKKELKGVALAVASMQQHMTNEGWEIMEGFAPPYQLVGHGLPHDCTDVDRILNIFNPSVILLQDKREWDPAGDFREPLAQFTNVSAMAARDDVFRVTILKDAHQRPLYHSEAATEMGCHAWIIYYHPKIVKHVAPYVRERHLIRTYHSVNEKHVPACRLIRPHIAMLSGAISGAYPLRKVLANSRDKIPEMVVIPHPGYHRKGSNTPGFLAQLGNFKISICTSSRYGYSLRKIIESVACGCRVITDLPVEDVLPEIDEHLVRVNSTILPSELRNVILKLNEEWDWETQMYYSQKAIQFYDYRRQCLRLIDAIELMRKNYE